MRFENEAFALDIFMLAVILLPDRFVRKYSHALAFLI